MSRRPEGSMGLWLLFAASSVAFLAIMAVSPAKDYFREYRTHQSQYKKLLAEHAGTAKEVDAASKEGVRVRQIWLPEFNNAVDRCTSCHLGVSNPQAEEFPPPLASHPQTAHTPDDVENFGCVLCHGGQGRATSVEEAHGATKDWDRPLLPVAYTEASCGKCHLDETVPEASVLSRGRELMREVGCYACHPARESDDWASVAPDLDGLSQKLTPGWLRAWLKSPQTVSPTTRMPDIGLEESELDSLMAYLWSLPPKPDASVEPSDEELPEGDSSAGKRVFRQARCVSCHTVDGRGNGSAPELGTIGTKTTRRWLASFIGDTHAFQPDTAMPQYRFSDQELLDLTQYFYDELYDPEEPEAGDPPRLSLEAVRGGERVFKRYGCGGCHAVGGVRSTAPIGPDLSEMGAKPAALLDFGRRTDLPIALPDWLAAKVSDPRSFADGLRMPQFNLDPDEVSAIVTALLARTGDVVPPEYRVQTEASDYLPPGRFGALVEKYRCLSCHQIEGSGGDISKAPLTVEGSRVQKDWMKEYLLHPSTIRPILTDRMVRLEMSDEEAEFMATFMSNVYVSADVPEDIFPSGVDPARAERGERLFYERYGCQACHMTKGRGGYYGPLLDNVGSRLRSGWIDWWLKGPQRWRDDIRCPNYGISDDDSRDLTAYLMTLTPERADTAGSAAEGDGE
jgi:cytochrome c2